MRPKFFRWKAARKIPAPVAQTGLLCVLDASLASSGGDSYSPSPTIGPTRAAGVLAVHTLQSPVLAELGDPNWVHQYECYDASEAFANSAEPTGNDAIVLKTGRNGRHTRSVAKGKAEHRSSSLYQQCMFKPKR